MTPFAIVILCICGLYMLLNFKRDIQMLQQNSYRPERYWRWLQAHSDIGSSWRLVDAALFLLVFTSNFLPLGIAALLAGIVGITKIIMIFRKKSKKPLVFTNRVKRIYTVTGILASAPVIIIAIITAGQQEILGNYTGAQLTLGLELLIAIFSWAFVMAAVFILKPVENNINKKYLDDAVRILKSMPDLKIIGITGSYGKTSTKHYLHRILSEQFETLMTPGSYNTPMGVIRTVRELMKPYTEVFICEMGAKQKGDIKEICDIVNPHAGIITAVGPMHLETFKSIENVQSTKFELADAIPANGVVVVNNDFEYCASRPVDNTGCIRYGVDNPNDTDYHAEDITYSTEGTTFRIVGTDGTDLKLQTKLLGACNISNLIAAVIIAKQLGVSDQKIQYAVSRIDQVEHRLSNVTTPGGITIIDDAFNSNPAGAKMAIDVLSQFKEKGRRIIITPGMIELGTEQYRLNKELGEYMGKNVDEVWVVGEYNREAIIEGLKESGFPESNMHLADTFLEAHTKLQPNLNPGDTVLYENDLPDSFK